MTNRPDLGGAPPPGAPLELEDWRGALPVLPGAGVTLREIENGDAEALLAMLTPDVTRFISQPPSTREGLEAFIAWSQRERRAGRSACFVVVPDGATAVAGLFQVRQLEGGFQNAEWGFAMASAQWGSGLFAASAHLLLQFAFDTLGISRLEARAVVGNGRGGAALRKLGAVEDGLLRRSFQRDGEWHDQALLSILKEDWMRTKVIWGPRVH